MSDKETGFEKKDLLALFASLFCGVAIIAADQITKLLIKSRMTLGESRPFLKGFLEFSYIHNRGGAWGIFSGKTYILLFATLLVMAVCVVLMIRFFKKNKLLLWAMVLVLSGGVGNMIDRIFRNGNVVDFLHFEFFPTFPVFNLADCAIVAGAGLLILYFLLDFLKAKKEKTETRDEDA